MEVFLKTGAGALVALVLILTVGKQERDIGMLLGIAVCCMTAGVALRVLQPVLAFLHRLEAMAQLQSGGMEILLKALGIGLASELVAALCADGGNSSMGKQVQLLGAVVILSMAIPLLDNLLELIQTLLGDL